MIVVMRRCVIAALLVSSLARADVLDVALKNQVPAGQKPSLTVTANAKVARVRADFVREDDGRRFSAAHGTLEPGQSATLPIGDGRAGRFKWHGTLEAVFPDGNRATSKLTFETGTLSGDLRVTYRRDRLDLDARRLEFQLSRPAGSASLRVVGDDGTELGEGTATYHGEPPGTWLAIGWTQKPGNVLRLELRALDTAGQAVQVKLVPWSVRIPHEEVVFDTGQALVKPSEEAKLHASYQRIVDAVAEVRKAEPNLPVRLFIAGHTDTVGAPADNRKLSRDRARAIAAWFRDHGLPLPIVYAGFGEDALKVKTPDQTDEPRNRRADYIVGVEEPVVAKGATTPWHPLR